MLRLELEDVVRPPRDNFDGNQSIVSLTAFPRLIQAGTPTEQVSSILYYVYNSKLKCNQNNKSGFGLCLRNDELLFYLCGLKV